MATAAKRAKNGKSQAAVMSGNGEERTLDAFRRWGYLQARLDPLGFLRPQPNAELDAGGEGAEETRRIYCGAIGAEFMHIPQPERREWIQERMEAGNAPPDLDSYLELLARAELFEQVLQARYLGTKRFSLEGTCAFIPLLDEVLQAAGEHGVEQLLLGMSHRGRLNVMVHTVGRDAAEVVAGFEDADPRSWLGSGDVKYHLGATGEFMTRSGHRIETHLVSNPSHLEAVDPVVMGRVRAKQTRIGERGREVILPIVQHGDAAFAGQGIWAETLNLSGIHGYDVGGTLHIIVNNRIGFTTDPEELHATRFCSDLAKRLPIPIFHVNAEEPEAVLRVARMALEYRYAFWSDVVIDLIGFRRHGHSEVDDPTISQPILYRAIQGHPPAYELLAKQMNVDATEMVEKIKTEFESAQQRAKAMNKKPVLRRLPGYWDRFFGGRYETVYDVATGAAPETLHRVSEALTRVPEGFHIHPKISKLLEQRAKMGAGEAALDYGMAEALAFGSLLSEGVPVRLAGQDSRRGTFNQRHATLIDTEDEHLYIPLEHVAPNQARFEVYNSILSEAAVLGFEYGYSRDYPETLVLWEAQFGDFANGAQVVIDQFISAAEDKWGLLSGVVMLLPHGLEGQGPEHSSARVERYLQLAARDNIQICQPSTAAQYFHLLRRQALRRWRKPLIVFTPKSMLRHPDAGSPLAELSREHFLNVVPENEIEDPTRMLLCTGKIGHELRRERAARKDTTTAILFLEQLYPFPEEEIAAEFARHPEVREVLWVQEEPANMGAHYFVQPRLERLLGGRPVRSVKRSASPTPATGSAKAHDVEQKTLLAMAFAKG